MKPVETRKNYWNTGLPTPLVEPKPVNPTMAVNAIMLALRGANIWGMSMVFLASMRPELALKALNKPAQQVYSGEPISKVTDEELKTILPQD